MSFNRVSFDFHLSFSWVSGECHLSFNLRFEKLEIRLGLIIVLPKFHMSFSFMNFSLLTSEITNIMIRIWRDSPGNFSPSKLVQTHSTEDNHKFARPVLELGKIFMPLLPARRASHSGIVSIVYCQLERIGEAINRLASSSLASPHDQYIESSGRWKRTALVAVRF